MASATERLDYADPWLLRFEAEVMGVEQLGKRTAVVLDRSAFYPESGGQMADRGTLGDCVVADVQIDEGRVLHFVTGRPPAAGDTVTGNIDAARRRTHMALHSGQHILSRALLDVGDYETVSSRLGETDCTIDLDTERADESVLAQAEALASSIIDDDVAVQVLFPDAAELAAMSLRKAPPSEARVRVVKIGDFDITPCGGTHCTRSAQIGMLKISSVERHKRQTRLHFVAGSRARDVLGENDGLLRALARELSCGPQQVSAAIAKLQSELGTARAEAKALGHVAASLLADSLSGADGPIVFALDGPAALIRDVAKQLCRAPDAVCLLAANSPDGTHVIACRGDAATFDCGAFMQRAAAAAGGRGGGRPTRAEGKLPAGVDWPAIARASLDAD